MTAKELLYIKIMQSHGWQVSVITPKDENDNTFYRAEKEGQAALMHFDINELFSLWMDNSEVLQTIFNVKIIKE